MTHIPGPGQFLIDIVGESHHQPWLEQLCGGRTEQSANLRVLAAVVLEDATVRVDVSGRPVGHLSRDTVKLFRRMLSTWGVADAAVSCDALIVGGWDRGPTNRGHFGVKLDLPALTPPRQRYARPRAAADGSLPRRLPDRERGSPVKLFLVMLMMVAAVGGAVAYLGRPANKTDPPKADAPPAAPPAKGVRRALAVGGEATLQSPAGEAVVRLVKTETFHRQWVEALKANDTRKQTEIVAHGSDPILPLAVGTRVKVLTLGDESAKVELLDGPHAKESAFCRPSELDPGFERP